MMSYSNKKNEQFIPWVARISFQDVVNEVIPWHSVSTDLNPVQSLWEHLNVILIVIMHCERTLSSWKMPYWQYRIAQINEGKQIGLNILYAQQVHWRHRSFEKAKILRIIEKYLLFIILLLINPLKWYIWTNFWMAWRFVVQLFNVLLQFRKIKSGFMYENRTEP